MRIKRIEIIGFKSFCDKTVLHIDEPITAVVGPNGCGKSNVVDAIRWAMGEQSAKHLRGKAMEDVIFAGSESRGPAGMAEVSLTFENVTLQHNVTPDVDRVEDDEEPQVDLEPSTVQASTFDFTQYGEVTVTRRLFRDGTSEYYLNKTICRLRDITDFFLGTGVGTKAYSIIEQGRIGMIVSAKPEDRRLVIEEAAGITKFKKKKQAAERKMDQTRQNLLRVSDVVAEIDKQLGSLRRQAQKAERYKKYRTEVKDIELWSASHRWLGLAAEDGLVRAGLEDVTTRRDAAHHDQEQREARIVAERAEHAVEERRLSELTQAVFDLENRIQLGESQVDYQTREARDLEERAQAARGEIDGLRRQLEETQGELERLRGEGDRLASEEAAVAAELQARETEQRTARETLSEAQGRLDGARADLSRAQADIARGENQQRSLERRKDDFDLRLSRVCEEEGRLEARHFELGSDIGSLDERLGGLRQMRFDLGQKREELETRLAELKDRLQHGEAEVETLRTELHRRRSRLHSLREIQDKYEGFARGTRAVMQHYQGGENIRGLVADIVESPPEYEPAVEAILGDRLGSILVDSHAVGLRAIDFLKQRSEGRSSFIPVDDLTPKGSFHGVASTGGIEVIDAEGVRGPLMTLVTTKPEYSDVGDALFRDILVVDTLPRALALWEAGLGKTLVTLDGDIVDAHGVVTGGSRDTAGSGVLQQKREIRELEEISAGLEQDLADATARHVSCKAELQKVGSALDAIRKDSHHGEMTMLAHEKDLARWRAEADRIAERRGQLHRERAELEAAIGETSRELEEARMALAGARERESDAEKRQLGLIEGVTEGRTALDRATTLVTESKVRAARAAAERGAAETQIKRTADHARELGERIERLGRGIEEGEARAQGLREEATRQAEELVGLRAERKCRAEELAAGRGEHEARGAALAQLEVEARTVRLEAERLRDEAARLSMKVHDLERERGHLEATIAERYRLNLKREIWDHHLRPPVGEPEEARLRELRELIERMGEINLTAIEEFEDLQKRYDFLTTQKKDLEQALDTLDKAIAKINRTSRKLFRETFEAVNAKFQEVFPRLFRGGSASLRLVGGDDDVLDAGVEIFAQPPGKKNTTVDLLSGGEKALTAVSLIFSIFLIKPSPFCLLDEVDAPLDEANVGRYNDIVREMTDRSQFIVITHNKRTMEIADQLYGITMEEPGCSKLVSVNLRRLDVAA
jgi:chromosome segregation protein